MVKKRSGRPSVTTDKLMQAVETKIREIPLLFWNFQTFLGRWCTKLRLKTTTLRNYVCSLWIPRQLTKEHKEKRFAISLDFLIHYEGEGDDMLSRIVTGDETWVSKISPESKQQSMEWRHTSSPIKAKAKQTLSKRKIMATVFWDWRGVLLVDLMPQGTTINSGDYCATLRKIRKALQNKRRGMLSKGVLLLPDNLRPHTSRTTPELIESFGWEV
ncbi:histone-lysine N-methyltransferase SETMAR [Trichonephila clavipes]|nr:histone-lysine N-methyltransferase SETMAR [Trichonephila clavipes]